MIAVDVVLLPPPDVMDKAVEINSRHVKDTGNSEIVLDRKRCLPHITLAMGCISEGHIERMDQILKSIAHDLCPLRLKTITLQDGKASIRIEKGRDIELLHELVVIRMSPFFTHEVSKDMIYNPENRGINDITVDYIREFPTHSSFENYVPHITAGHGDIGFEVESFGFIARDLALCHLGDFCTCRKILCSHRL